MKVKDFLTEDKWIQKFGAINSEGVWVSANDESAVKWCLIGAIYKCYELFPLKVANKVYDHLRATVGCSSIATFNDTHTYEEVIALAKELDI